MKKTKTKTKSIALSGALALLFAAVFSAALLSGCTAKGSADKTFPVLQASAPAPSPSPSASQLPSPEPINVTLLELRIHELINVERTANGLNELAWNDVVANAARKHSEDMVARNYFEHNSPEGHDFLWRYSQEGFVCEITVGNTIYQGAENIHQGWTYGAIVYTSVGGSSKIWRTLEEIAEYAVDGWMNSPPHRKNILTPHWLTEGIGVAIGSDGKVLVTQDFC